ncbi:MAG TPA: hypothetical protein VI072_31830 [Polyangiaceae bacterium]
MAFGWVLLSLLLLGCTDEPTAASPPLRCDAGSRCSVSHDASADAHDAGTEAQPDPPPPHSGTFACPAERDSTPVVLAERFGYPSRVIASASAADPAIVIDGANAGSRATGVDVATCQVLWSLILPDSAHTVIGVASRQLVWMDGTTVVIRDVDRDVQRRVTLHHTALALHLDAEWLYVLTADQRAWGGPTWLERVARSRLTEAQVQSEPWIRMEFNARSRLIGGSLSGSSEHLIALFWSNDLDETVGPAIRIDRASGAQLVFSRTDSQHGMLSFGDGIYQQRGSELLEHTDGQAPRVLRTDLEMRELVGIIAGHAIAREPSAQLLLALPFDGSAPVQLADEQAAFAGVATSGNDVLWVNWARRLMAARGVPGAGGG